MGLGVVSVCLPTYRPLFSMVIPKLRTKMASFGSGWDSDRGLQAALPEIPETEETPNPSDVTFLGEGLGGKDAESGLGPTRPKPSQSRAFDHIGILGGSLDLDVERGGSAGKDVSTVVREKV